MTITETTFEAGDVIYSLVGISNPTRFYLVVLVDGDKYIMAEQTKGVYGCILYKTMPGFSIYSRING